MNYLEPKAPRGILSFPDFIHDLSDLLKVEKQPVYVVGGAVRDAVLRKPTKDVDLVTPSGGTRLARRIANYLNGDFYVLDAERDVGRAIVQTMYGRTVIDVSGFRDDDLYGDLHDRDFTMNAMAVDIRGEMDTLFDPLDGERDALAKIMRRCNPQSIANDPIRAMRAVRQSTQFGAKIEPETLKDIRKYGHLISSTSPERVRDEFFKMLDLLRPVKALRVMDALGLLEVVVPEVVPLHDLEQPRPHMMDAWRHTLMATEYLASVLTALSPMRDDNITASFGVGMVVMQLDRYRQQLREHIQQEGPNERSHRSLLLVAALMHDTGKAEVNGEGHEARGAKLVYERAGALKLSNGEQNRLRAIVAGQHRVKEIEGAVDRRVAHRYWRDLGAAGVDVCLLTLANYLGTVTVELKQDDLLVLVEKVRALLEAYYDYHYLIVEPAALLRGDELAEIFDLTPGPIIGEVLAVIREEQAVGAVTSREAALEFAAGYLEGR